MIMQLVNCSGKPDNPLPEPPDTSEDAIRSGSGK
jgi:hypothetical protein